MKLHTNDLFNYRACMEALLQIMNEHVPSFAATIQPNEIKIGHFNNNRTR